MVVAAPSATGLSLETAAATTDRYWSIPASRFTLISSRRTIEFLIIKPIRLIAPSSAMNEKGCP